MNFNIKKNFRKTFTEEEKKRRSMEEITDLIMIEDPAEILRNQRVEQIKSLYNNFSKPTTSMLVKNNNKNFEII